MTLSCGNRAARQGVYHKSACAPCNERSRNEDDTEAVQLEVRYSSVVENQHAPNAAEPFMRVTGEYAYCVLPSTATEPVVDKVVVA